MQIVLMRHGKPKIDKNRWVNAREFGAWVEKYKAAGIDPDWLPPQFAIAQANQCAVAVCSNLPRSLQSAKALGIEGASVCEPMFREMDMPYASWPYPRLSLAVWSVLFRLVWALGYSAKAESYKAAKARAHRCAERLANLASAHGSVLFVGHGLLNVKQHRGKPKRHRVARETLALTSCGPRPLIRLIDSDSPRPPRRREGVTQQCLRG